MSLTQEHQSSIDSPIHDRESLVPKASYPMSQWDVERIDIGIVCVDGSDIDHVANMVESSALKLGVVISDCIKTYLKSEHQSIIDKSSHYSFCLIEDPSISKDFGLLFAFNHLSHAFAFSESNVSDNHFDIVVYRTLDDLIKDKPKQVLTYHLEQALKRAG
ncbi:MAG: hypothetical protein IBX55_01695 [Methyloprofundus sp.]|nr:hypothetical protein [Methyloprofundus sp.]